MERVNIIDFTNLPTRKTYRGANCMSVFNTLVSFIWQGKCYFSFEFVQKCWNSNENLVIYSVPWELQEVYVATTLDTTLLTTYMEIGRLIVTDLKKHSNDET